MLLQNSTLVNNLTQGWETCSLRIPELKTFFFFRDHYVFQIKNYIKLLCGLHQLFFLILLYLRFYVRPGQLFFSWGHMRIRKYYGGPDRKTELKSA